MRKRFNSPRIALRHYFRTPIRRTWRHVKTLYRLYLNSRRDLEVACCHVSCGRVNSCASTTTLLMEESISLKMLRNKCAKVVLRIQWLVRVEGSWETVVDSSLVQCKTRFVQLFYIFFFIKHVFVILPLVSYPDLALSYAVGDLGTRLPIPFSLTLSIIYEDLLFCHNWSCIVLV